MKTRLFLLTALLLISLTTSLASTPVKTLTERATSVELSESNVAIAELRSLGPSGLDALMTHYANQIKAHVENPTTGTTAEWHRITHALDAVSQQKNSYLSGLYWYKDLNEAKKAAAVGNKPILSLRLLGNLTDELSCANSRFFRTVLYPNKEVSSILRDQFVLHWESVRPVPVVTIDFGDGRKLQRTITGNSIHYVLDSDGELIEALPGLYGPQAFTRALLQAEQITRSIANKDNLTRQQTLKTYYRQQLSRISLDWYSDTRKIGGLQPAGIRVARNESGEAVQIMPLAITKMETEASILRGMMAASETLGRITDEAAWRKIARLHEADAVLDARSLSLIEMQNTQLSKQEFNTLVNKFQQAVALDTVRNEYLLHSKLYGWLMLQSQGSNLNQFNDKVYAELFLTPRSDPWLGLLSADTYMALDQAGRK